MSFTTNRLFGLELELIVDKTKLFKALSDHNIPYVWFNKQRTPKQDVVVIKPEVTIKGVGGIEINFPPTFSFDLIEKVVMILKTLPVSFSNRCALHVHVDVSDVKIGDLPLIKNYYLQHQEAIITAAKEHQLYVKLNEPLTEEEPEHYQRRVNLNIKPSVMKHGTVEHRIYATTLDLNKIQFCIHQSVSIVNEALKAK